LRLFLCPIFSVLGACKPKGLAKSGDIT